MISGRDILTYFGLSLKFSEHVIEAYYGPFKGSTTSMVGLGTCIYKDLNTGHITPK